MRFAILSLVAAIALSFTAGTADARPFRNFVGARFARPYYSNYGYGNYGYNRGYSNYGNYGNYGSGFSLSIGRGYGLNIGSGSFYPNYGYGYGNYSRPYYGGYRGYGRRW